MALVSRSMVGPTTKTPASFSDLASLHVRHCGLDAGGAGYFAGAAHVALTVELGAGPGELEIANGTRRTRFVLAWPAPGAATASTHRNRIDRAEVGAYAVALAAVEAEYDLVAVGRAEELTGADWILGSCVDGLAVRDENLNYEGSVYLEVAGSGDASKADLKRSLDEKKKQLRKIQKAKDKRIAAVISFSLPRVVLKRF